MLLRKVRILQNPFRPGAELSIAVLVLEDTVRT